MPDLSQILLAFGIVVAGYLVLKIVIRVASMAFKLLLLAAFGVGVYFLWSQYLR